MSKVQTMENGEIVTAPGDFQECLDGLALNYRLAIRQREYYRNELERVRDEKWRDKELQKLACENENLRNELAHGFSISEQDNQLIQNWIMNHNTHPLKGGVSGGTFSYIFTPTSIGIFGTIKCNLCGKEYTFSDC